jgi:hypothetical protein
MAAVEAALAWQLYQQTAMPVVQAGPSWSMAAVLARLLAVPGGLPWQLYRQDCLASCRCANRTIVVTLVLSFTTAFKVSLTFSILL